MSRTLKKPQKHRLLIIGAGVAGRQVVQQINTENRSDIDIVGFVDDDLAKQGKRVAGVHVLGTIDALSRVVRQEHVNQVLISTPSVGAVLTERVARLLPPGFSIKVLPSVSSVIFGKADLMHVRDVDPTDFIGRPVARSNQLRISKAVRGKRFLVTGGAGSIGSEIVRQLCVLGAKRVVVIDSWEEGIFNLTEALESERVAKKGVLYAYLGNIRDRRRIEEVLEEHPVDVIIHAAAYKHVHILEDNSGEAQKTNYGGTKNLLDIAVKRNIKDFVFISTDKAVRPVSVLGKTKRAAELLVKRYAAQNPGSRFSVVRFGNVLNSSGSVLPKFLKQIRSRQPVTVTHFEMTRYFMAIPEAVSLVLLAWIVGKHGQILVLDMGEPVKILDFAEHLIRSHGLEPYQDISIHETGIRKGEKIHEELTYEKDGLKQSAAPRVFIAEELSP